MLAPLRNCTSSGRPEVSVMHEIACLFSARYLVIAGSAPKALCKRSDPFAQRAIQHACFAGLSARSPLRASLVSTLRPLRPRLSAFQLFCFGGAVSPEFLPASIISRIGVGTQPQAKKARKGPGRETPAQTKVCCLKPTSSLRPPPLPWPPPEAWHHRRWRRRRPRSRRPCRPCSPIRRWRSPRPRAPRSSARTRHLRPRR